MTEEPDVDRVESRAHLLPEEMAAGGIADPEALAAAVLDDSDRRTAAPEETRRESVQTPD